MKRIWTDIEIEIIKSKYPFSPTEIIARELNRTLSQVYNTAYRIGLKKDINYLVSPFSGRMQKKDKRGLPTRFPKGYIPWNKGKKGLLIGGKETQFKKGHIPKNHKPVGSIRKNKDGYIYKKVREPNIWTQLHRYIWEKEHGIIPKTSLVQFKDKNPENCELSNLYLSDRIKNMENNTIHRYPPELKFTIRTLNKLKRKINGTE